MKDRKVGAVRDGRIPIYDDKGRMRGNVGAKATSVTVSRFIGRHGAKLTKVKGRTAWVGPSAPMPNKPETPNAKSARGSNPAPRTSYSFPK